MKSGMPASFDMMALTSAQKNSIADDPEDPFDSVNLDAAVIAKAPVDERFQTFLYNFRPVQTPWSSLMTMTIIFDICAGSELPTTVILAASVLLACRTRKSHVAEVSLRQWALINIADGIGTLVATLELPSRTPLEKPVVSCHSVGAS